MAVMLRCSSCFFTSPNSITRSPPSDPLHKKSHAPGKIATLSYKVERFVSSSRSTFNGSSEMCQMLPNLHCQENKQVGIPTMAFLISNPLMLSTSFKALAETCEADNSVFNMNMPLLLSMVLKGKTIGGLLARQRRVELERLNEQLHQINATLRRRAKIESYAPSLSYAPVGGRRPETEVIVDPKKQGLISQLKCGKNFL